MTANLTGIDGDGIIRDSIERSDGYLRLLQVSPKVLEKYIKIAGEEQDSIDTIQILAGDDTLKEVMDDFIVSSEASDLIKNGKLEILSTGEDLQRSVVIVGESSVMSYIDLGDSIGALSSDDDTLVDEATSLFSSLWESGDDFKIRTPPITDVKTTLRDEIGEETQEDFTGMLDILETAKGDGEGLDEITVALLA
ncbi:MAG: DUF5821 family protein, partial [Halobacteria archaeon]|nr:DUF5821 family protein [Halobacteria archaeon]